MDLFKTTCDLLKCENISDIRSKANLRSAKGTVALLDLNLYSLSDLKDMAQYLYGGDYSGMNKDEVIAVLKTKCYA